MDIITLDFETFFDTASDYTLRKMTTEAYVRDARFQAHGCAVRWANGNKEWLTPYEINSRLVNLPDRIVLAHHAHFDGLILAHHYGLKPRGWIDTLPMARLLLGNHVKVGLESLAAHFGLGAKTVPYALMDGRQWNDMTREVQVQVLEGGKQDCELEFQLFNILAREFPAEEYGVIDATIRMFTEPKIIGDRALLAQVWQDEVEEKRVLLERLGVTVEQLRSDDAFIALLHQLDVQPEYKYGKNGPIPAFAKSDDFMRDLLEDADDTVRLLAEARLDAKSTLNETRAARLGWMATRGAMAVYINYCGAHTTRDSGGDKVNWQNFQRKHKLFPKRGRIRQAMCAPAGYRIGVVDASQIECRMLNEFSGQTDICDKFREKRDLYSELATICYGFPVTKANEAERGTGKQLELSCGYGAGDHTIMVTAKKGIYGPPVVIDINKAREWKEVYRGTHQQVVAQWRYAGDVLKWLATSDLDFMWGSLRVIAAQETGRKRIILPNGAPLIYDTLEWHVPEEIEQSEQNNAWDHGGYWRIRTRRGYAKMYGAKLIENVIQALARVHLMQVMLKLRAAGLFIWLRAHDELGFLIEANAHQDAWLQFAIDTMRTPPAWMPNVPLDAEGIISERYEK